MKFILISCVKFYRLLISPLTGQSCRFHPTCSAYMIEAIECHGVFRGLFLGVRRIFKCHPYHKGPYLDPVPDANEEKPSKLRAIAIATKGRFGYKRK